MDRAKRTNPKYLVTFDSVSASHGIGMGDMGGFPEEGYQIFDSLKELGSFGAMYGTKGNPKLYEIKETSISILTNAIQKHKTKRKEEEKQKIKDDIKELQKKLESEE